MKKFFAVVMACAAVLSLCACAGKNGGSSDSVQEQQTVNPMTGTTREALEADTGIDLGPLGGVDNVSFYRIDTQDKVIANAQFECDGVSYDYRAAAAAGPEDISGMYYTWTQETAAAVGDSGVEGSVRLSDEGAGVISWYDAVPGIMYSLSAGSGATAESLSRTAGKVFAPVQGDSGVPYDPEFADDMYGLLIDIRDNYHPDTAGASLKQARYAAEMADLFARYRPDAVQVRQAVDAIRYQRLDDSGEWAFDEQINSIAGMYEYINSDEGKDALADSGYEPAGLDWDDDVAMLFDALRVE